MNPDKEELFIKELMRKSVLEMPFDDFEEKLMYRVQQEKVAAPSFLKEVKLSWFFFTVGTIFGFVINIFLLRMDKMILGLQLNQVILIIQTVFVIFLLLQVDKLVEITKVAVNRFKSTTKSHDHEYWL